MKNGVPRQNASILSNTYEQLAYWRLNVLTQCLPSKKIRQIAYRRSSEAHSIGDMRVYARYDRNDAIIFLAYNNYDVKWIERKNIEKHFHSMVNEPWHISLFDKHQCVLRIVPPMAERWQKNVGTFVCERGKGVRQGGQQETKTQKKKKRAKKCTATGQPHTSECNIYLVLMTFYVR